MSSNIGDNNNDNQLCGDGGGGSGDILSSKKECTSCEQNNVDNITKGINSVAVSDVTSMCANCGKEGNSDDMNICNKCKTVKYCNAACKKKHRSKHKKACEKRVAELHDEALFKEPPAREECPICFLSLPIDGKNSSFKTCCGQAICNGCIYEMKMKDEGGVDLCPFCREPNATSAKEHIKRTKTLMEKGNAEAFSILGGCYANGLHGMPQDIIKANELYLKSGELGCSTGYYILGIAYDSGTGVEVDVKKAKYYYELAAMSGNVKARNNLGYLEGQAGNYERAYKHFMIAARGGYKDALDMVKVGFMHGDVTKDEYANTLRAHQQWLDEIKSEERDKADLFLAAR